MPRSHFVWVAVECSNVPSYALLFRVSSLIQLSIPGRGSCQLELSRNRRPQDVLIVSCEVSELISGVPANLPASTIETRPGLPQLESTA